MKNIAILFVFVFMALLFASCSRAYRLTATVETESPSVQNPAKTMSALQTKGAASQQIEITRDPLIILVVSLPDGSRLAYTYAELESLSVRTADLFDKPRAVIDISQFLSSTEYPQSKIQTITFDGVGSLTLIFNEGMKAGLYLNEGKADFYSGSIPAVSWPTDIALIVFR